jgi:hypothetical protein
VRVLGAATPLAAGLIALSLIAGGIRLVAGRTTNASVHGQDSSELFVLSPHAGPAGTAVTFLGQSEQTHVLWDFHVGTGEFQSDLPVATQALEGGTLLVSVSVPEDAAPAVHSLVMRDPSMVPRPEISCAVAPCGEGVLRTFTVE